MSNYSFAQVPTADIPRSVFNRSHGHKTTFDAGKLIPFYVDEVLPGDTFKVHASLFARLATPIVPIMDNMHLDVFFFFVPNRLVWANWQKFMGEQENPDDSIDFRVPVVQSPEGGFAAGSLFDYFGVPIGKAYTECTALHARAYNLIYNEWFRDQNLIESALVPGNDGPDTDMATYPIRSRGKRHDYFTSCLPWPQKGPGVELPVGGSAHVIANPAGATPYFNLTGGPTGVPMQGLAGHVMVNTATIGEGNLQWAGPDTGLVADLSTANAVTINSLRQAFQIQKLLERDARGGTRYIEILRSHFGVVSPDARLQRPEYLGGGSIPVTINPVSQTSQTTTGAGGSPQGNLAGFGIAAGKGIGFSKSFVEHGVVLGICMVRADLSYYQGLPRMFNRRTRYDFYWPAFAHLGEQAVLNGEIYYQGAGVLDPVTGEPMDKSVFGYQERWAEYRYAPSKITGKFRRTAAVDPNTLDYWHLAQWFSALPVLNEAFITEAPPVSRVIAVQSEPQFLFDSHIDVQCTRPMPTYSVPGLIDHF